MDLVPDVTIKGMKARSRAGMGFIIQRPECEPRSELVRREAESRQIRYTLRGQAMRQAAVSEAAL